MGISEEGEIKKRGGDGLSDELLGHSSGNKRAPKVVKWQDLKVLGPDDEDGLGHDGVNAEEIKKTIPKPKTNQ